MADIFRIPLRMDCNGIDLVSPLDRMPKGYFPYIFNARILQEGRIDGRPGYTSLLSLDDYPNSVRRLNDPGNYSSPAGYAYVGGGGTNLYFGTAGAYTAIDNGYSGDPLSLIPFRPDQSVEDWMYVYDRNKSSKISAAGEIRAIGIVPPNTAPGTEYGVPAWVDVTEGQSATSWAVSGSASAIAATARITGTTIGSILYNDGTNGWCCVVPSLSRAGDGARMAVVLGTENVVVREVHKAIAATTIATIQYDAGSVGACSVVLIENVTGLERNSVINLGGELVRILEVVYSPDGSQYSLRLSTTVGHSAGEAVDGRVSWYLYTVDTHVAGEAIASNYLAVTQGSSGAGAAHLTSNINASIANGRRVDPANDYLHISVFITDPSLVSTLRILMNMDAGANVSFGDPGNSYIFSITGETLRGNGAAASGWVEVVVPISSATRTGADFTKDLSNITAISVELTATAACNWGFDWWYLFGTYGPEVQVNSPIGLQYQSRYRDSTTGAKSVPGPLTRYSLFPLREAVIITLQASVQSGVDTVDHYRMGASVSSPLYVGSVFNAPPNVLVYLDGHTDAEILAANQPPDVTALQPWPILGRPLQGTCQVNGTSIQWKSGDKFNAALIGNTVILIDGVAYLTYGSPRSDTVLEITQDAGYRNEVWFQINSPVLAGQPLPFVFGPLEGPFAPFVFGLGDPVNGGRVLFTNANDLDSSSSANFVDVAPGGNDLVSGATWKNMVLVGNREALYGIRFSYLTGVTATGGLTFQWDEIKSPSGVWSRWAMCSCPLGVAYLGRDGIYIASDAGGVNITDERLYPLFPHDGQVAAPIQVGQDTLYPVDMTQLTMLRLSYCDESLRFTYLDTAGNYVTLIYEIYKKRWLPSVYHDNLSFHYLVEGSSSDPNQQEILALDFTNKSVVLMGGNTDAGTDITTIVLTPSLDNGDERAQKLYVDSMVQAQGVGTIDTALAYDSSQSFSSVGVSTLTGPLEQLIQNIASKADLSLYRNIACKLAWTGGPDGPKVFAWEPSGYLQPYLSTKLVTQYSAFSFPGWKHMRRMYPTLISNYPVIITVRTQDGREYGPYMVAQTGGQYRTLPFMLDQCIKDLAFLLEIDGQGHKVAIFPEDFVCEVKSWTEETYILLAVFRA